MDIGAFVVERMSARIHPAVAEATRGYFRENGLDIGSAWLSYALHPRMPAAIVIRLWFEGDDARDVYLWCSEHAELAATLANRLGCGVWCFTREGRTCATGCVHYDRNRSVDVSYFQESSGPLGVGASRLGVPRDLLEEQLEMGSGATLHVQQPLAGPDDPRLLQNAVDELLGDPRSQFPGREAFPVFLPDTVVNELEATARRVGCDIGLLFWAAWEWGKPDSYKAFVSESGKKRRPTASMPPSELVAGQPKTEPEPLSAGQRVKITPWVPTRLAKQLHDLAEFCDRGVGWVFMRAYPLARARVLAAAKA
jgi:hypothetical protein